MPQLTPSRLVLLSGWGVDQRIWQSLAHYWPEGSLPLSIDWPGYGEAPALPQPASIAALADAVSPALPSDAVWVGWSLGGLLATALLDYLPAPRGLILIGAGERFCSHDKVSTTALASFQRAFTRDPNATWRHFLRWQCQGEPNARHAHRQLTTCLGDTPSATHHTLSQGLDWLATLDNTQRTHDAPCPILRIVGEHDPLTPPTSGLPTRLLADAGHCPMLSQPAQLAALITEHAAMFTQQAIEEPPCTVR